MNTNNLIRHRRTPQFYILLFTFYILAAAVAQEFPLDTYKSFMQNEPNFQTTMQTITLIMAGSYNENIHLSTQKSKPNTNPIQTQFKPKPNPKPTQYEPKTNPISKRLSMRLGPLEYQRSCAILLSLGR
jgi:hypothetical protein